MRKVIVIAFTTILAFSGSVFSNEKKWDKPVEGTIPNAFGNGYMFYGYYRAGHTGIDIAAKTGTPVKVPESGVVHFTYQKPNMRYGNYVVLRHYNGFYSLYGHLKEIKVKRGQKLKKGEILGTVGVSGLASFPHLHFEITDRVPINDGAWGYNFICQIRKEEAKAEIKVISAFPKEKVENEYNFRGYKSKYMSHFYRPRKHGCIEEKISPITYYNPEDFLPEYKKASLPDFKPKKRVKKIKPSPMPSNKVTVINR